MPEMTTPTAAQAPEIVAHHYSPDYQSMGDCRVCGHEQNKPWHIGQAPTGTDDARKALEEIVSWKHDTLGKRESDDTPPLTADFDRGARMAFYRCADRAAKALATSPPAPDAVYGRHIPQTSPAPGDDSGSHFGEAVGARESFLAEAFSHSAIDEAMQDSWNDICLDTGCHPLDIEHGKGKQLNFRPHHWANQIAKRLFLRAVKLHLKADAALPSEAIGREEKK